MNPPERLNGLHNVPAPAISPQAPSSLWEAWYRTATPAQQQELLALAQHQGFLYIQQLPAPANGVHAPPAEEESTCRDLLRKLLQGQQPLSAPPAGPFDLIDTGLDHWQQRAVGQALHTPDVSMVLGQPGTGKSRVTAEIILQLARRGHRILFLAKHASAIDIVLERLAGQDGIFPIRFLHKTETVSAAVQPFVYPERSRVFRSQALTGARNTLDQAEERWRLRLQENDLWPHLHALAERRKHLLQRQTEIGRRQAQLEAEARLSIAEPVEILRSKFRESADQWNERDRADQLQRQKINVELAQIEPRLAPLEELFQASHQKKWWTLSYWKAALSSQPIVSRNELRQQKENLLHDAAALDGSQKSHSEERARAEENLHQAQDALLKSGMARLQQILAADSQEWTREQTEWEKAWQEALAGLPAEVRDPLNQPADLARVQELWQHQKKADEAQVQFARQWSEYIQGLGEQLVARLPRLANLAAGPLTAWEQDPDFAQHSEPFDYLVLEEAHLFTEAELLDLARRARKCILVGAAEAASTKKLQDDLFPRLWKLLHGDLTHRPYQWRQENGRWICQLHPLTATDRGRLECEPLADNPGVDLCILSQPRARPVVAEVRFPSQLPLDQAKPWVQRELEEWPLQLAGSYPWSEEVEGAYKVHFSCDGVDTVTEIEPGIKEFAAGAKTVRLEFAQAQLPREARASWLEKYLGWRDAGRAAHLPHCYRMNSNLSACIHDIFQLQESSTGVIGERVPAITFIPVPSLGTNGKRLPREGAGLEVDLAGTRFADKIPAECRVGLPRLGFANYFEAQGIVHTLERLAKDNALPGRTGILAFHSGQVELIRRLLAQSATLTSHSSLEVGLPAQFRDRELDLVVIGLTRSSNIHRTGQFDNEPGDAILALTRSRSRLILVGDPGTLIRWSQTEDVGQSWVRQLARYLQGQGSHQQAFHLCEGV